MTNVFQYTASHLSFECHAVVLGEHLGGLLLEALSDEDVGVEEPVHAVPHAVEGSLVKFVGFGIGFETYFNKFVQNSAANPAQIRIRITQTQLMNPSQLSVRESSFEDGL